MAHAEKERPENSYMTLYRIKCLNAMPGLQPVFEEMLIVNLNILLLKKLLSVKIILKDFVNGDHNVNISTYNENCAKVLLMDFVL